VGQDADVAVAALNRRENALEAIAAGLEVKGEGKDKGRVTVGAAIAVYLSDTKDGKAPKTYTSRKRTLELFQQSCSKIFLDQIETRDMLDFRGFLKRKGLPDRTVFNHFEQPTRFCAQTASRISCRSTSGRVLTRNPSKSTSRRNSPNYSRQRTSGSGCCCLNFFSAPAVGRARSPG
jgi:hypothetical protein